MFYYGLSTPAILEKVLGILQPWLGSAEGDLRDALVTVIGVMKSPMNADFIDGVCYYQLVVACGLMLALSDTSDSGSFSMSDENGKAIEFDDESDCRDFLRKSLALSDERVDEAWNILADFGVMRRKLDLSILEESTSHSDDDFCL